MKYKKGDYVRFSGRLYQVGGDQTSDVVLICECGALKESGNIGYIVPEVLLHSSPVLILLGRL